ncbi:MAG: serpin family protein [Clostridia bacterium]|nr:serpin family protein [Clostridia bacterium]
MHKVIKVISLLLIICLFTISTAACVGKGKCTLLGTPAEAQDFTYEEGRQQGFLDICDSAEAFAAAFASATYEASDKSCNFAVSPVSVYMALSLAAECASGETREEILSSFGMTYEQLQSNFQTLYRSLIKEFKTGQLALSNSVWLNEGTQFNQSCIDALSQKYYCYSYAADFANDNKNANLAVRHFVKEQTKGLIDNDFKLSTDTLFTLINSLYLKDTWNEFGKNIDLTDEEYTFAGQNGEQKEKFLLGSYKEGRAYTTDTFSAFFTSTYRGYQLKFFVPEEGYTVGDIFTAENIALVNSHKDYNAVDEINKIRYHTRCVFPQFNAGYDKDVKNILQEQFGISSLFNLSRCNLSNLMEEDVFCSKVYHITKLCVDRKGIEGAAVTVIPGATSPGPDEYTNAYLDFVVDKSFGFMITDPKGTTLFSGVVAEIE